MPDDFTDISITEFDDEASRPSGEGALMQLVLRLSESPPSYWADYFDRSWSQHFYMMKRRAAVSGDAITIVCMPEELQHDHLPQLKKVIAETNEAYRARLAEVALEKEAARERATHQRQTLSELKQNLKLD